MNQMFGSILFVAALMFSMQAMAAPGGSNIGETQIMAMLNAAQERDSAPQQDATPEQEDITGSTQQPQQRAIAPQFEPKVVSVRTEYPAGTIIIDTNRKYLYLVQPGGKAMRYGVGVGRPGFEWTGTHTVTRKAEWPDWRPPAEMRARQPYLPEFVPGGEGNPLGARALYLGSTLYRIHGSNEPWSIGQAVSSGCIRMRNEDVMDLYEQVGVGTKVIVF